MIHLKDIRKTYVSEGAETPVLHGVSLHIDEGEFVALMGTSGSGKTTLLNIIGGLDGDYQGSCTVAGQELRAMGDRVGSAFRNRTVSYIFQHFYLLNHLPVLDNVLMPSWFDPKRDTDKLKARAIQMLDRVGLAHKVASRPNHLSGGEKQRVAIARALFNAPKLLLCDEPTGALDSATTDKVFRLIETLNRDEGLTVLVVTHERAIAERCDRIIHMVDGLIVGDAS